MEREIMVSHYPKTDSYKEHWSVSCHEDGKLISGRVYFKEEEALARKAALEDGTADIEPPLKPWPRYHERK